MGRFLLSVLLSVNLLACPLRCASCTVGKTVAEQAEQPSCCCCAQECEAPEPDAPSDRPSDECNCQDCICEGATLQDALKLPNSTTVGACVFVLPVMKAAGNEYLDSVENCDPGTMLGGRVMRIAHQSLLI